MEGKIEALLILIAFYISSSRAPPTLPATTPRVLFDSSLRNYDEKKTKKETHRLGIKVGLAVFLVAAIDDNFDAVHRRHQRRRERHASREGKESRPLRPCTAHKRGEARVERERRRRRGSRGSIIIIAAAAAGIVSPPKRREQAFQACPQCASLGLVGGQQRSGRLGEDCARRLRLVGRLECCNGSRRRRRRRRCRDCCRCFALHFFLSVSFLSFREARVQRSPQRKQDHVYQKAKRRTQVEERREKRKKKKQKTNCKCLHSRSSHRGKKVETFFSPCDGAPRRRALPSHALWIYYNIKRRDAELEGPSFPHSSAKFDDNWTKKGPRRRRHRPLFDLFLFFLAVPVPALGPAVLPQGQTRGLRAPTWDHFYLREREGSDRGSQGGCRALEVGRLCHFEPCGLLVVVVVVVLLLLFFSSSSALAQRADHGAPDLRKRRAQSCYRD